MLRVPPTPRRIVGRFSSLSLFLSLPFFQNFSHQSKWPIKIFQVFEVEGFDAVLGEVQRLDPAEILIPEGIDNADALKRKGLRRRPVWEFEFETAQRLLTQQFNTKDLSGFGCDRFQLMCTVHVCYY